MSAPAQPLVIEARFEEARERRTRDRRIGDRRGRRPTFDPLFAATLVNHVARVEAPTLRAYPTSERLRPGVVVNIRA